MTKAVRTKQSIRSMRDGYGDGILEAAKRDSRIVVLCADLTESTKNTRFKERFPKRFVQVGVQEQLLAALGAGMALAGKIPFLSSYAVFSPGRSWEQVRTNICLNNANVKIIGSHAGIGVGPDGATHQALEDIAVMRCLPHMTVIAPSDAIEAEKATRAIAEHDGPCYMRLAREATPVCTTPQTPFKIGRGLVLRDGMDVAVIACGTMVAPAVQAAARLEREHISCMVIDCHTIKPLDTNLILKAAAQCGAVVTAEDHQIAGGLGSAVAECLGNTRPTPIEFVGVRDRFGQSGQADALKQAYGLTAEDIEAAVRRSLTRKEQNASVPLAALSARKQLAKRKPAVP